MNLVPGSWGGAKPATWNWDRAVKLAVLRSCEVDVSLF